MPAPVGVPCTSETDLEAMVVETDKGPDLFVPIDKMPSEKPSNCHEKSKVWISDQSTIQGHYIYRKER